MDPFASVGEKFRFLLQLPAGVPVGLTGAYWNSLADDFQAAGLTPVPNASSSGRPLGAAFVQTAGWNGRGVGRAAARLGQSAGLVVLIKSRLPDQWSRTGTIRAAARKGLALEAEFLPVPTIDHAEAFLSPELDRSDWQLGHSRFPLAAYRTPRDRLLFLRTHGGGNGFAEAGRLLNAATGDDGFAVERFHLRRRGALVMVLRHQNGKGRVIRIATNSRVAALARWNQEITRDLRAQAGLAQDARELIPEPLGAASNGTVEGFAESFHPGRLAWLLYRNEESRKRIDEGLFRFSHGLQSATCRPTRLDGEALAGLLARYLNAVEQRLGNRPGLGERLGSIRDRLRQLLGGRVYPLCAAHGDYGVGNAIATPEGNLTAIIDWDQFQPADPAGVDWCDYRIKAESFRRSVFDSLPAQIAEASRHGGVAPPHPGFGGADFGLGPADMAIIPCLAVLREIARSAGFPGELARSEAHYKSLLDLVGRHLPESH